MSAPVIFRVEIFKDGGQYVGLCPELGVSSFGDTEDGAEAALREAVQLFIEQCEEMGTLKEVLEEAGFEHVTAPAERWVARAPVKSCTAEV